jgi:hypothetical protein
MEKLRNPKFIRTQPRPFRYTERDLDYLVAIGRHQIIQSSHLDRLFPDASAQNRRRRLQLLFNDRLLHRPREQIAAMLTYGGSTSMAYTLTQKGASLVAKERGLMVRPKLDTKQLEHALEVSDVTVAFEEACRQSEFLDLLFGDDVLRLAPAATRDEREPAKWRVPIRYGNSRITLKMSPDATLAIQHREDERARKYFFLEADRLTMPVERREPHQTSILRKLLAYGETYKAQIHRNRYGMSNMRVLFVTKSPERVASMLRAAQEKLPGDVPRGLFLFTDRGALFNGERNLFDVRWRSGTGEEVTLLPSGSASAN